MYMYQAICGPVPVYLYQTQCAPVTLKVYQAQSVSALVCVSDPVCTNVYQSLYMCIGPNVYGWVPVPVYVYQTQCVRMRVSPSIIMCRTQCAPDPVSDPMFNSPYVRVSDTMSISSGARVSGSVCTLTQ